MNARRAIVPAERPAWCPRTPASAANRTTALSVFGGVREWLVQQQPIRQPGQRIMKALS